jgi:hypothetical protein
VAGKGRRTSPPRPPAGPPANAEEGAARLRALLVKTFDRKDGTGADWRLMLESLYRAGFKIADDHLEDDARRKMRRVHEGAEVRLTGGYADGSGASDADFSGQVAAPSNIAEPSAPGPRPPR